MKASLHTFAAICIPPVNRPLVFLAFLPIPEQFSGALYYVAAIPLVYKHLPMSPCVHCAPLDVLLFILVILHLLPLVASNSQSGMSISILQFKHRTILHFILAL